MGNIDLQHIEFLIGKSEPSLFQEYMDTVANRKLLVYRTYLQWGAKQGESLYTHVLNGIQVLETLCKPLSLSDEEARLLFTAFTIHDLNKVVEAKLSFSNLVTHENIAAEIERLGLDDFFPGWQTYGEDLMSLIRGHGASYHAGGERLFVRRNPEYRLGLDRINALVKLMKAADRIDLSHTLEEQAHKDKFLSELNAFLADTGQPVQYEFFTHRLTEQRGILTNVFHNAIVAYLQEEFDLLPLLFYPDGVAYLVARGKSPQVGEGDLPQIARRINKAVAEMTMQNFEQFIEPRPAGIKVDAKCLELGLTFDQILDQIYNIVAKRDPVPADFDAKAREYAQRNFEKNQSALPLAANEVIAALDDSELLVSPDPDRLRQAEFVRTYYIFLDEHFSAAVEDAWQHIYQLLDLPEEKWDYYAYFDARWARAYVLSRDFHLSEEELYQRINADGAALMAEQEEADSPNIALFTQYLKLYGIFGHSSGFVDGRQSHLAQYVTHQHRQCVYCSGPFPTDKWMAADVRSDITVQTFSNRLRGGGGEPKKYICAVCQLQFLLEKLNYPEIRGEKALYLHLFPYSFLTEPFIQGLQGSIQRIAMEDGALQALNMNSTAAVEEYIQGRTLMPTFRSRTNKDRPQPYGLYLPQFANTVGNLIIFPINPAGDNDTERFLYALWNALVLQRYFGVKVLLSDMAVTPFAKEDIPDLYVDNIPLGSQGLLPRNDFAQFVGDGSNPGPLATLWDDVSHLFALRKLTFVSDDNTPRIVRAMVGNPLGIFYTVEKLLEAKVRGPDQTGALLTWLMQEAHPHVLSLTQSRGGALMAQLSEQLNRLAEMAWQNRLLGRTLKKSSLLFPVAEVFQRLGYSGEADLETLRAATTQEIFDHLERIADDRYKPGRTKLDATKAYVDVWFDDVLGRVYHGNRRKFLSDEKLIRSAYHFYIRQQIPRKTDNNEDVDVEESDLIVEESL
ncbi:MAG: type I-D CRISPR-associated protein Cas10d/Csc3 [Caldilineaceae bacterium]|nr:type I-D CRISPR-associated protein Cas10d/Csc3 [Caldilineaceae bacterium]